MRPVKHLPGKLFAAALLGLSTLPLTALMAVAFAPLRWQLFLLPVYALLSATLLGVFWPRRRLPCGLVALLGLLVLSLLLLPFDGPYGHWAACYPVFCAILLAWMLRATTLPAGEEFPLLPLQLAIAAHLIAFFLLRIPLFAPAHTALAWGTPCYLLCLLLLQNQRTLAEGVSLRSGGRPPTRILWRNRLLVLLLGGLAWTLVNLPRIRAAFYTALSAVGRCIVWLFTLLSHLYPDSEMSGAPGIGGGEMGLPISDAQPSWLLRVLERLFQAVALLVAAALAIYLLYRMLRLLRKLWRALMTRFAQYAASLSTPYEDEAESVWDWGEIQHAAQEGLQRTWTRFTRQKVRWASLDGRARIRYVFALLQAKRPALSPAHTARQAILQNELPVKPAEAAQFSALYDVARYSDHPVSMEEAEAARRAML